VSEIALALRSDVVGQRVRHEHTCLLVEALEPKLEARYMKRVYLFFATCSLFNLPMSFCYQSVAFFLVIAMRSCLWSSLESGYIAPLRWYCNHIGAHWLWTSDDDSADRGTYLLSRLKRAHEKRYVDLKKDKTLINMDRIAKFAHALRLTTPSDLWSCTPEVALYFTILIVAHSGGMRYCEIQDGCRVQDFTVYPHSVVQRVGERYSAKKLKWMPARDVHHHHHEGLLNASTAIRIFYARFHAHRSAAARPFFFRADAHGKIDYTRPPDRARWYAVLKSLAAAIGLSETEVQRTTHHGIRAGATVDYLEHGQSVPFVRKQLGWAPDSKIFERHYVRRPHSDNHAFAYPALAWSSLSTAAAATHDTAAAATVLGDGPLPPSLGPKSF
jgi:hypothetical protein